MEEKQPSFVDRILIPLVHEIGAEIFLEPEFRYAGYITFKNGKRAFFREPQLNVNPHGAADIALDKGYTKLFLEKAGFRVPNGLVFFRPDWAAQIKATRGKTEAIEWAEKHGFPVIVKPNSKSQGNGVFLAHDAHALARAIEHVFTLDDVALVEEYIEGNDVRIIVCDGVPRFACLRERLSVLGDEIHTIAELFETKKVRLEKENRKVSILVNDARILATLSSDGKKLSDIPQANEVITLLSNANLSTGGDVKNVSDTIHPSFLELAQKAAKHMTLFLAGVDLMIQGDISDPKSTAYIIEMNSMPGMKHFASLGKKETAIVTDIYRQKLKKLERDAI